MKESQPDQPCEELKAAVLRLLQTRAEEQRVQVRAQALAETLAEVVNQQGLEGDEGARVLIEATCELLARSWVNLSFAYIQHSGVYTREEFAQVTAELQGRLEQMLIEQSKQTVASLLLGAQLDQAARKARKAQRTAQAESELN